MLIPPRIIEAIKVDPTEGAIEACNFVEASLSNDQGWTDDEHAILLETYALVSSLSEADLISVPIFPPSMRGSMHEICKELSLYLSGVKEILVGKASVNKLENLKKHFAVTVANGFGYEFSDGDLKRVQTLLNELRDLVADADDLTDEHKQRLLKRLETLQQELHKKTSDLSRYYGLIGEAGVVLGKVGKDAKPIVDRIKELMQITWNTQSRAEELPSGTTPPLLEKDSDD